MAEFELLDAKGRTVRTFALPGIGLDRPLRYAVEFAKGDAAATFALRVAHTRAADFTLSDVVVERAK